MTSLKAVLASPDFLKRCKIKAADLVLLSRAIAKLVGEGSMADLEETEALQRRIIDAADGEHLSGRDLREGAKVFFHPPHAPGRMTAVSNHFVGEVKAQARRSALFGLIDSYLDAFAVDDEDIANLGRHLEKLMGTWKWRDEDGWHLKHAKYGLFKAERVPAIIAKEILGSVLSPEGILADAGLDTALRRKSGLSEAAFVEGCKCVSRLSGVAATSGQVRLMTWAQAESDTLTYPNAWADYGRALFLPWKTSQPEIKHQNLLVDTAVRFAGDPRVQPRKWKSVDGEVLEIVMRWLTKTSFEQFFAIVDEMTDRPDMWRDRKKFWRQYLEANLISAAWVVFGAEGAERAARVARQTGNETLLKFGRLSSGGGKTPQHTALIMKIGDLTIVEWSHNGKWNIWRKSDPKLPALNLYNPQGLPEYDAVDLMSAPLRGAHGSAGGWKYTIQSYVYHETGLRP